METNSREYHKPNWIKIFKPRESVNAFTHFAGALLSILGLYLLVKHVPEESSVRYYVALYIFGISLILLYTTSGLYHLLNVSKQAVQLLRRIDHMMIYVLIAGTYTPLCLIVLEGSWRWGIFFAAWTLSLLGIVFKIVWFRAPRWLSTASYMLMGWMAAAAFLPLSKAISLPGMICLVLGGMFYSAGAVIYAIKWPRIKLGFLGFHEIFHLFVLAGSFSHYMLVYRYI